MLNALQGVDGLVGGLNGCMEILRERSADRAERSAYLDLIADYTDLVVRHNAHLETIHRQTLDLECERANHAEAARMCKLHFESFLAKAAESDRLRDELEALKRAG